ncbi:MAG: hypothetical protein WCB12_23480 [Bryobacteraceae bacterium]
MVHLASQHSLFAAIAFLIALVVIVRFTHFRFKRSQKSSSVGSDFDSVVRLTASRKTADPFTYWRDEIFSIAEKHGSPGKAARQIERSINTLEFKSLEDAQLKALHEYWMEMSDWCGKIRIELHSLDPERRWSPTEWTRLFNMFGRVNLLVQIAWSERCHPRSH